MSVLPQQTIFNHVGNGVSTVFAFGCRILDAADLQVRVNDVPMAHGVDFSITGVGSTDGGSVVFVTPPANLAAVRIFRSTLVQRSTDYQTAGEFKARTVNDDFDRPYMLVQDIVSGGVEIGNTLRAPAGEALTTLPAASVRANKVLGWDSLGQAVALVGVDPSSATALDLDLRSAASASVGAGQLGFAQSLAYTSGTLGWALKVAANISAKFFGAIGDGVVDDTAALNAWLAAGGGYLPPGTYKVTTALLVSVTGTRVIGAGAGLTLIQTTSGTADIFTCSANLANVLFADFSVWSTVTKSAGNTFTCPTAARYTWRNVVFGDRSSATANGNRLWRGIDLQGCDDCNIITCQIAGYQNEGVRVYGVGAYNSELHITGGTRISLANVGVRCSGNFGGLVLGDVSVDACVKDCVIDQTSSATINREIFIESSCILDACSDTCLEIAANGCSYLEITGGWLAAAGAYGTATGNRCGLYVHGTNAGLQLKATGARFFSNTYDGAQLNALNTSQFIGCDFTSNGRNGLWLAGGASLGQVNVIGGKASSNLTGLQIAASCPSFNIDGLDLSAGNTTKVTNASGYSTTQAIRSCPGYVTENSGAAVILSGTSSIVFNHGLAGTPTAAGITICPITSPGASVWFLDATSFTSTQATIRTVANAAANISFRWQATLNTYV